MDHYVGLDVSLKQTHFCVVDGSGAVVARGHEATHPELLAAALRRHAPFVRVVVLETGGQSSWLQGALASLGLPAVIVDARRAKAALSCRMNKTDANDAEGLAQLAYTGWYRRVTAKRPGTRLARSLLLARQLLVKHRRDIENQVRALLRGFGLSVGAVSRAGFEERVWQLVAREPGLEDAVDALLQARRSLCLRIGTLEKRIGALTQASEDCRRLMTVPGVGPMSALAYVTAIDDTHRFAKSSSVGAYLGLGPVQSTQAQQKVPLFIQQTYPEQAIKAAVAERREVMQDGALDSKTKYLIALGVAAQIPCRYCVYFHTKAAKHAGATNAQIKEAIAAAALVRKWSTVLNGSAYDFEKLRHEVDAAFAGQ